MKHQESFFEWEDSFKVLENVEADIYTNGILKISNVKFEKIDIFRNDSKLLNLCFYTQQGIYYDLIKNEDKNCNLEVELKLKESKIYAFNSIVIHELDTLCETFSYTKGTVETKCTAYKIIFLSDRERTILKEWYGCNNKLNFYHGLKTSKVTEETIKYKIQNSVAYEIKNKAESFNKNSFWVKLKDYKFKVSIIKSSNDKKDFNRYVIEYREKWGMIPNKEERYDISTFLSFVIGTKLIKFGESYFNNEYLTQKEYISPCPIDISFLYQANLPFFSEDYRYNDTDMVIKQLPKMMQKYFQLKEKYRLNEVFSTLFIKSYLNFNFINYVTYIEMLANIDVKQKKTLISSARFRKVLKDLNKVKNVPKCIKDKFQILNTIGIGKNVQRLLSQHKIEYSRYKDVFHIRGKVVHGANVDVGEMYIASEKAKELLTILTLKKLNYTGYIRNFVNSNELILMKDMSKVNIESLHLKNNNNFL